MSHTGTLDAADQANISYRQIDYWCRRGYIHADDWNNRLTKNPQPVNHGGSGTVRLLDETEFQVLLSMAKLVHAGLPAPIAAKAARYMNEKSVDYAPLGHGVVVATRTVP